MLKVENKSKEEIAGIGRKIGEAYDGIDEMYGRAVAEKSVWQGA